MFDEVGATMIRAIPLFVMSVFAEIPRTFPIARQGFAKIIEHIEFVL
jgi:hypothetical protein